MNKNCFSIYLSYKIYNAFKTCLEDLSKITLKTMVKPETEFSLLDRKQSLKGYKQKKRKVGGPKQNAKRTRIVCVLWSLYHIICVYSNQVVGLAGGHWTRTQLRM